jgi:hypothetical protein
LVLVAKAASVVLGFSCGDQTLVIGAESGPLAPSVELGPGVVATAPGTTQSDRTLAAQITEIRKKAVLSRTAEEHQLVEQFFEAQAHRLNALDPLSRAASQGGYMPNGSDLETYLREVGELFRRWR